MPTRKERTPRVGDTLELVEEATHEEESGEFRPERVTEALLVRKELPCERYMVKTSDGDYRTLFICPRTKQWWTMPLNKTVG